jgi:DNA-directed RNA polymerase specialized sigma24 family protein
MITENAVVDSDCEDGRLKAQGAVAELYQLAALMVGNESQAAELVEAVVARTEVDPCADAEASVQRARLNLVEAVVSYFRQLDPRTFDPPALAVGDAGGCIDSDDLASAGVSANQLAGMVAGPGRGALRGWLGKLSAVQRMVFVQRAILGWDSASAATLLGQAGLGGWETRQVSEVFRQALCSLATSLVQSAAAGA